MNRILLGWQSSDSRISRYAIIFLLYMVALGLILGRMWGGGFTGGDEPFTATASLKYDGIFNAAVVMAKGQSRFYQLIYYVLAQIPYLYDSLAWVNFWRILSSFITISAFSLFAIKLFKFPIGILSSYIYLAISLTSGSGYNAFHALPLWFNIGIGFIFLSYLSYCYDLDDNKITLSVRTGILFGMGILAYELLLPYFIGFVFILSYKKLSFNMRDAFKALKVPLFIVLVYLVTYYLWRVSYPPSYPGTSELRLNSLFEVLNAAQKFSFGGIFISFNPKQIIKYDINYLATSATLIIFIGTLLAAGAAYQAKERLSNYQFLMAVLCFLLVIYSPNIILSLSPRYLEWVKNDSFYHGSYYSAYFIATLLALCLNQILQYFRLHKSFLSFSVFFICASSFYLNSLYANQNNSQIYFDESVVNADRWRSVNILLKKIQILNSDNVDICTNTLIKTDDPYDYWSLYLSHRAGKRIRIIFSESPKSCENYLIYDGFGYSFFSKTKG